MPMDHRLLLTFTLTTRYAFPILGVILIALEFLVDGTVGVLGGGSGSGRAPGEPLVGAWTWRPAAFSSTSACAWPCSADRRSRLPGTVIGPDVTQRP
ncbi:hypothetical protein NDR87_21980 [Nocardia sp. CDC159]|uniref:hypothetical protein n=1 Tax=Nocardia TaxID=1817 RepID=UPI002072BF3D|nr:MULTISPECIES: hypothetical protein [Nocardia]MCM6789040.1 hypothetical protein [Nocardia sp. CDC159]